MDNKQTIFELRAYLNNEFKSELIAQLENMPIEKVETVLNFVNRLKEAKSQFSIHKIEYNPKENKVSVDANFHLDSF
jgi:hypothetical protein